LATDIFADHPKVSRDTPAELFTVCFKKASGTSPGGNLDPEIADLLLNQVIKELPGWLANALSPPARTTDAKNIFEYCALILAKGWRTNPDKKSDSWYLTDSF
jgi:hypothetical protein